MGIGMVKVMALSSDGLSFADGEGTNGFSISKQGFRLDIIQKNSLLMVVSTAFLETLLPSHHFGDATFSTDHPLQKKEVASPLVKQGMG
jgi:hypothetical protein